jgi:hypothetical protein
VRTLVRAVEILQAASQLPAEPDQPCVVYVLDAVGAPLRGVKVAAFVEGNESPVSVRWSDDEGRATLSLARG